LVFSMKQKKQEPSAAAAAAGKCANKVAAAITAALIVSQRMAAGSVWQDAVGQTSVGSMGNWVLELVVSGAQLWEDSLDKTGSSALRFHNDDTHILGALSSFSTEGRKEKGRRTEGTERTLRIWSLFLLFLPSSRLSKEIRPCSFLHCAHHSVAFVQYLR